MGIIFTMLACLRIFFLTVKPKGYEETIVVIGSDYIRYLILGILSLVAYHVIKNSTPVNP